MQCFLENNPTIEDSQIFVDKPTFEAYNTMGIGIIFQDLEKTKKGGMNFKLPKLSFDQWKDYLKSINQLTDPNVVRTKEVVTRLGATYAIDGEDIVYSYEEGVPGDNPNPLSVLEILTKASS